MSDIKKYLENIKKMNIKEASNNSGISAKNINDIDRYKNLLSELDGIAKKDRTSRKYVRLHVEDFQKVFSDLKLNIDFGSSKKDISRECNKLNLLNKESGLEGFKFGYRNNKESDTIDIKLYTDYKPISKE